MYFLLLILSITITKKRKGHKRESSHFRLSSRKQKKKKVNLTCKGEEQKVKANKPFQKFSNFNIECKKLEFSFHIISSFFFNQKSLRPSSVLGPKCFLVGAVFVTVHIEQAFEKFRIILCRSALFTACIHIISIFLYLTFNCAYMIHLSMH